MPFNIARPGQLVVDSRGYDQVVNALLPGAYLLSNGRRVAHHAVTISPVEIYF